MLLHKKKAWAKIESHEQFIVLFTHFTVKVQKELYIFPPLRLDPRGTGLQIWQDNVHMKKTENIITEHASLPLLPNLQPFSYFSLLPPLILTSVFLLLPLI